MNLEMYKPKETKYKAIFRKHGISTGTIANYLGLSYPYVCSLLNGIFKMPKHIDLKLKEATRGLKDKGNERTGK